MKSLPHRFSVSAAFSLVEVCFALGIASFTLLAIVGMLPVGIATNRDAIANTIASGIASSVMAEIRNAGTAAAAVSGFDPSRATVQTQFVSDDGQMRSAWSDKTPYRVTVQFMDRPGAGAREARLARILVTWPAAADRTTGSLPSKYSGAFETLAALDIN